MTFDEALAEMQMHAKSRLEQESYLESIHKIEMMIQKNITPDELKSWKLVEMAIRSNSKLCGVNEEHVRDLLNKV